MHSGAVIGSAKQAALAAVAETLHAFLHNSLIGFLNPCTPGPKAAPSTI
jgi:hypothetical protein